MKKIICDTVVNFYKQPKKYNRSDNFADDPSDGAPGPIRDLVNDKGPMAKKAGNKSVDFSKT